MTINELITLKHVVRLNYPKNIIGKIDEVIEEAFQEYNICTKTMATDYVVPRILQSSKGERILIWDQTYWELFSDFLMGLADLCTIQKGSNVKVKHKQSTGSIILGTFSNYLALIVNDQNIAIKFARYYNQKLHEAKVIQLGMSLNDIKEYVEIAKLYLAVHERMHFIYKQDSDKKGEDLSSIKQMLDIAYRLIESFDEKYCNEEYLRSKSELMETVNATYSDTSMQEEILCDMYALNNCLFFYRKSWEKRLSQKEVVTKCLEAIRIVGFFNSALSVLKVFWQDCKCDIQLVNPLDIMVAQRNYLSEIIAGIQLAGQNLYDYDIKELWKFNGLEDNYSLEDLIYSYFFSEEAVHYWKDEVKETNLNDEIKKQKFQLLGWRVS